MMVLVFDIMLVSHTMLVFDKIQVRES